MSSNNTTTNDAGNYSPASFGVLPILDLSIYVALSILSLYNIVLTWHYRPLLETSKVFTGFVAAGSWVWFICNASYIPYLVSCVNVDILQDYNSVQVIDFLNFVNDVTFTGSFILYQGATIYRFKSISIFIPFGNAVFYSMAVFATIIYSLGFFAFHPYADWCYWVSCDDQTRINYLVYVVYDTVSEFVFSLVDITLGLLVMFVVTRTRRKGTKDVNLYSKMKNRSIRFIAAWIAVSVLAMILMIISLSLKPGDGTSLVDMPGIFHDLSRVCINIEFIFSIQFMLMMKEWILYSTGSEDPQSEARKRGSSNESGHFDGFSLKSLIKSKKSPLPLSTTPSSKKDKLLSKHDLLSDSIISVGARSKFQPAALAEQQPCTSNIDRISLGKSTSPFKATSPTYSSALIKCTNGSAQGIKSFGGGGGGGTTSSKKSSSSLHNLTSGSGISKQHNRDKSINGGGIGLFRTMSGGRNSITDGFPSKRNSLTLSAAPPQRKRSDTSSFTPSEIVVERQEDNDEEEEEEGYEEVVVVKRVGSGGGKGMTLSASARSGLKGGTGMSLLETSDLIEEVYEE